MARKNRSKRRAHRKPFRLLFERLEDRHLMAANLRVSSIDYLDMAGNVVAAPAVGEQFRMRLNWLTTDLTSANSYQVQASFGSGDNQVVNTSATITGAPGVNVPVSRTLGPWFATPGAHRMEMILDSGLSVTESNESDNRLLQVMTPSPPATLPQKFLFPVAGDQNVDWVISGYVDVQTTNSPTGLYNDFRSQDFADLNSTAVVIDLSNYSAMDAGVAVRAAAAGRVTAVVDNQVDRAFGDLPGPSATRNSVTINHGNGWVTRYTNFVRGSITVRVNDVVTTGQTLGLVGGSDRRTATPALVYPFDTPIDPVVRNIPTDPMPRLFFEVRHFNGVVETFVDPTAYWLVPPEYQADTQPAVLDAGVTNNPVTPIRWNQQLFSWETAIVTDVGLDDEPSDLGERPSSIEVLHPVFNKTLTFWYDVTHLRSGDSFEVVWERPDGSTYSYPYTREASATYRHQFRDRNQYIDRGDPDPPPPPPRVVYSSPVDRRVMLYEELDQPWNQYVGQWYATLLINGAVAVRAPFKIDPEPLIPEIRVSNSFYDATLTRTLTQIVNDERTTPINFGVTAPGVVGTAQSFTIQNHGTGVLSLSNLQLPAGFSIVNSTFPSQINPGDAATFEVALDTTVPGQKFGEIRFTTDDPSEPVMNFNVLGTVSGALATGTPTILLPGPATAYQFEQPPVLIDPTATVADSDSANFDTGSLKFEIVSGLSPGDVLSIRNQGTGAGQIGVSGNSVTFQGNAIGTFVGGTNGAPLVVTLNTLATPGVTQTLARNIQFSNTLAVPDTRPRYVRPSIVDAAGAAGKTSVLDFQVIVVAPNVINQLPKIATLTPSPATAIEPAPVTLTATGVTDADGTVSVVDFYLESNGLTGLQTGSGGDTLIGRDDVGTDGWSVVWDTTGAPNGTRTLYAQAIDNSLGASLPATATVNFTSTNAKPTIVFVSASPDKLLQPAPTTLKAHGVLDADGLVKQVEFYLESNGVAGLQVAGDTLIGTDLNGEGGWTTDFFTTGMTDGRYTVYASALDFLSGRTITPPSTTIDVGVPPVPGSLQYLADLLPANGGDGSEGVVINGFASGDSGGFSVSAAGDVNGDGYADVIIGAPLASLGSPTRLGAGSAYLVLGNADGLGTTLDVTSLGENGVQLLGSANDSQAGVSVSSAGDVNGDGFDDFLVGEPSADVNGLVDAGAAYLIFGTDAGFGASIDLANLASGTGVKFSGLRDGDALGSHVASIGDMNGDGLSDFVVAAPAAEPSSDAARTDAGVAYVVYGKKTGWTSSLDLSTLNGANGFRVAGLNPDDLLGAWAGGLGDINADGLADLGLGAPGYDLTSPAKSAVGTAYVVFGKTTAFASDVNLAALTAADGVRLEGVETGDAAGTSLARLGDVNGDAIDDFAVAVDKSDPNGPDSGTIYVFFGHTGSYGTSMSLSAASGAVGSQLLGINSNQRIGYRIGGGGDLNGDGLNDVVVGVHRYDVNIPNRPDAGSAFVVLGTTAGWGSAFNLASLDGTNGFRLEGIAAGDRAGRSVAIAGDLDGDGLADLLIGAPGVNGGAGEVYAVYGRDYTNLLTHVGNPFSNNLDGTSGRDFMIADASNDNLLGRGGADVLRGAVGDDVLVVPNLSFAVVDGGPGLDTLRLDGQGLTLDLATLPDGRLANIELIDITGTGNNTLNLSYREVLNLSGTSNSLFVERNQGDVINLGTGWTLVSQQMIGGAPYNTYTQQNASVTLRAVNEGRPWQNQANPLDVDAINGVIPTDVLIVINYLNDTLNQTNSELPNPPVVPFAPPPIGTAYYYDTNGDGYASAIDALLIINYLNSLSGNEGEGEGRVEPATSVSSEVVTRAAASDIAIDSSSSRLVAPLVEEKRAASSSLAAASEQRTTFATSQPVANLPPSLLNATSTSRATPIRSMSLDLSDELESAIELIAEDLFSRL